MKNKKFKKYCKKELHWLNCQLFDVQKKFPLTAYYISDTGDDKNDGKTPETPKKTFEGIDLLMPWDVVYVTPYYSGRIPDNIDLKKFWIKVAITGHPGKHL